MNISNDNRKPESSAGFTASRGSAWVVVCNKSNRITIGSQSTPQLYLHRKSAAEMALALKPHIGQCRVVRVNYHITPNTRNVPTGTHET